MQINFRKILFFFLIFPVLLSAQDSLQIKLKFKKQNLPFGLTALIPAEKPVVGIALSGGGARGFSELGLLKVLEKNNIPISIIAGTSIGSILGGFFSIGYSIDEIYRIINSTDWDAFINYKKKNRQNLFVEQKLTEDKALFSFRLKGLKPILPKSINTGEQITTFLNSIVFNAPLKQADSFDSFLYKLRIVCTNLVSGKKVVLKKGSLLDALRASSSVSFLLPPVKIDSSLLVDGGLTENLPVDAAKNSGADFVIAFNAVSPLHSKNELNYPWQVADQIVSIPMHILTEQEKKRANILIEPDLGKIKNTDFRAFPYLFKKGLAASRKALPEIKNLYLKKYFRKLGKGKKIKNLKLPAHPNKFEKEIFGQLTQTKLVSTSELKFLLYNLFEKGYFSKLSSKILVGKDSSILKINYQLNPEVKKIKFVGQIHLSQNKIKKFISPLLNKPFNPISTKNKLLNLLRFFREKGLSLISVTRVKFKNNELKIFVNAGKIDEIKIEGNKYTNKEVILRELPFKKGEILSLKNLRKGLLNLQSSNLFTSIEFSLKQTPLKNTLIIKVEEKEPMIFRFGMRADNENFMQLYFDFRNENLLGNGSELGVSLFGGERNRSIILEQRANRIFDTYLTYKLKLYRNFNDVNVYQFNEFANKGEISIKKRGEYRQVFTGISLGFGVQAKKIGNVIFEGRYEQDEIKNKLNFFGTTSRINIATFKIRLFIDSRNKYPYTTSGSLVDMYYETAQKKLGGSVGYSKFYFNYKDFFTIHKVHTISPQLQLGFADKTLPLSQQFALGGQYSFSGLREFALRGRQIFKVSMEYTYKLPFKIFFNTYTSLRYDLGSVWKFREAIKLKNLRHGIGATISFDTPIGQADFSIGRSFTLKSLAARKTLLWGPFLFYFRIGYYY